MVDLKVALRTTLLLVDDDIEQLEARALLLKMSGFTVLAAGSPAEAITIMAQRPGPVDVAILDYEMPVMNGCVLADYLRARYPELAVILYSSAVDIPESELGSIDALVPKGGGVAQLLEGVAMFMQLRATPLDSAFKHGIPVSASDWF